MHGTDRTGVRRAGNNGTVREHTEDALTPADEQPDGVAAHEIDPQTYRKVLGCFPTGVTIVTAATPAGPVGLSIGSFTSVSLDPPLVGFLPARASQSWPRIYEVGQFCVNVLGAGQEDQARLFAAPHDDRFDTVKWQPAPYSGAPLLDGVAAWIDCAVEDVIPAGDHVFVLGRVHELDCGAGDPLVFHQGAYRTLDG
jgi:3-hydroxy-9,10-secoandrosta-1,3,5(10)-triene-9,17-dione monooxygenase reductase component